MTDRIKVTIYKDGDLLARKNAEMTVRAFSLIESWQKRISTTSSRELMEDRHYRIMGSISMLYMIGLIDGDEREELEAKEIDIYSNNRMRLIKEGSHERSKRTR